VGSPSARTAPLRAPAAERRRARGHARDPRGRGRRRRRQGRRRPPPPALRPASQDRAGHAPSTSAREPAPDRRRRSRIAPSRTRAASRSTRRTYGPAKRPASRSGRRRADRAGRARRDMLRTAPAPDARRLRSGPGEATGARPRDRRYAAGSNDSVPTSRQIGAAASSSRRSSCASARSPGVLIGKKRPRGPRLGTSRYVVGRNTEASW